jgi:hypothetical protein
MSASLLVDLFNTCQLSPSLPSFAVAADAPIPATSGGFVSSLSGVMPGDIVDLLNANTVCNVYVVGKAIGSGPLIIGVQTSDSTTSGSFTDPTSGLPQLPGSFSSGGQLIIGSGDWSSSWGGIFGSGVSGQVVLSGFFAASIFQRPHRYARLLVMSGFMDVVSMQAGFISQLKTTGSGGGFTYAPGSGVISV